MTENILKYEETVDRLSCYSTEGCGNIPWPIGVPPPFKPPTRFDVLRWDYFNETHLFLKNDNDVTEKMKGLKSHVYSRFYSLCFIDNDYEDIHEVIDYSVQQLQKKYGTG
jgi:hypothetical protein